MVKKIKKKKLILAAGRRADLIRTYYALAIEHAVDVARAGGQAYENKEARPVRIRQGTAGRYDSPSTCPHRERHMLSVHRVDDRTHRDPIRAQAAGRPWETVPRDAQAPTQRGGDRISLSAAVRVP